MPQLRLSEDDEATFLADMRALRDQAGIAFDELAARAHYPSDVLKDAECGPGLPTLPVTAAYVSACGGDVIEWEERWRRVASAPLGSPDLPLRPPGASPAAAAGARAGVSAAPAEVFDADRIRAALRGGGESADSYPGGGSTGGWPEGHDTSGGGGSLNGSASLATGTAVQISPPTTTDAAQTATANGAVAPSARSVAPAAGSVASADRKPAASRNGTALAGEPAAALPRQARGAGRAPAAGKRSASKRSASNAGGSKAALLAGGAFAIVLLIVLIIITT